MKFRALALTAISANLFSLAICAAPAPKPIEKVEPASTVVEIPRSDLVLSEPLRVSGDSMTLDLMVSSWAPVDFQMPTTVKNAPSFETDVPLIKLGLISSPVSFLRAAGLSGIAYVGYMKLSRTTHASDPATMEQTVHLIPMQVGIQTAPTFFRWKGVRPSLQIYALPTLTTTPDSSYGRGRTDMSFLYGSTLGIEINPFGFFSSDARDSIGFHLGATVTSGEVQSSQALGFGLEGGLLVRL